ncbi:holo-ACP synthase [Liberiplasma polymorphum]|uniref:holo-ACP synthase n=1 Tax=Liberiplasma polymorphum TaxID=3374570 RepID=UPI003774C489
MTLTNSGLGIDLVEIETIKEKATDAFINRILSTEELALYNRITHPERKLTFLAGRFAAKEAYVKAYQSFDHPLNFKDVVILNNEKGAPYIKSKYRNEDTLLISISHTKNYAVAIVQIKK